MYRLPHLLIGAGCGAAVAHVAGLDVGWSMLVGAVGASLPDMDLKWADRAWEHRPRPGSPCRLLDHRGPLHSIMFAVLAGVAVGLSVAPWAGLMLAVGVLSHLLSDGLSFLGVPFLWPICARRFRLMPRRLRVHSGQRLVELPIAVAVFWVGLNIV